VQVFVVNHADSPFSKCKAIIIDFFLIRNPPKIETVPTQVTTKVEKTMKIDIQARDFPMTDALKGHVESRLRFALASLDDYIQRIVIRLSDINGPRGGADKRCQIQLVLDGMQNVVIKDTQADMYAAISRSADRARRTLVRKVGRQQHLMRRDVQPRPLLEEA
jgi:ribosomal subunit interface protein